MKTKPIFECVLPDGRFARIRTVTWGDVLQALIVPNVMLPALAVRVCTLDEKPLTLEEWLEQDLEDVAPIIAELNKRIAALNNNKGVA